MTQIVHPYDLYKALLKQRDFSQFQTLFEQHKDLFAVMSDEDKNNLLRSYVMSNDVEHLCVLLQVCNPMHRNSGVLRLALVHKKHASVEVLWRQCDPDIVIHDIRKSYHRTPGVLKIADDFEVFVAQQRRDDIQRHLPDTVPTAARKM